MFGENTTFLGAGGGLSQISPQTAQKYYLGRILVQMSSMHAILDLYDP